MIVFYFRISILIFLLSFFPIIRLPYKVINLPYKVLTTLSNGTEIRNGGFGSAATCHPQKSKSDKRNLFYALTDRGPNITFSGEFGTGKKFPIPDYKPRIGLFELKRNGNVKFIKEIILKNPFGNPITGLPNPEGLGSTGEIPYDNEGNVLEYDKYGLDGEGIVALKNGEFWISDEYGPHIVHFDSTGKELERISPVGVETNGRKLPAVLKRRRANRGMEGLTITSDERTLVGIMQSTLSNPSTNETKNNKLTRIVTFDLSTGDTKQYLYMQDKDLNGNCEITALSNTSFLVIERDSNFSGAGEAQKSIYKVDISKATDVSGDFNSPDGLLLNGKTLEQCSIDEINNAGIIVSKKSLVVDLVSYLPNNYPHDKAEAIWLIDKNTIGVINDDDFAITEIDGNVIQKILPGTEEIDRNTIYIIKLDKIQ